MFDAAQGVSCIRRIVGVRPVALNECCHLSACAARSNFFADVHRATSGRPRSGGQGSATDLETSLVHAARVYHHE